MSIALKDKHATHIHTKADEKTPTWFKWRKFTCKQHNILSSTEWSRYWDYVITRKDCWSTIMQWIRCQVLVNGQKGIQFLMIPTHNITTTPLCLPGKTELFRKCFGSLAIPIRKVWITVDTKMPVHYSTVAYCTLDSRVIVWASRVQQSVCLYVSTRQLAIPKLMRGLGTIVKKWPN